MKKRLSFISFVLTLVLLILFLIGCQTNSQVSNATPTPLTKTIVHTNIIGSNAVGTMAVYMYKGQQLSLSFHSVQSPVIITLLLPDNTSLNYNNSLENIGLGKLISSSSTSSSSGRFTFQSSLSGFHIVQVQSAGFIGNQPIETDCELEYEIR